MYGGGTPGGSDNSSAGVRYMPNEMGKIVDGSGLPGAGARPQSPGTDPSGSGGRGGMMPYYGPGGTGGTPSGYRPPLGWPSSGAPPASPGGGPSDPNQYFMPGAPMTTAPGGGTPRLPLPGGSDPFSRPTSAMDVYRSAVPVMQDALKTNVGSAMADAGFSGNRFGSYAMDRAAQEGAKTSLQQNQLLTGLLHDQTNRDQDRSLQAAGMGMQHGISENQMQLDRMKFLADQGRWEQGRQDQYGLLGYQDFENNKLGFLDRLMQMAQSPGTATAPTWGTQQTGGSPGFADYAKIFADIYGAYQGGQG